MQGFQLTFFTEQNRRHGHQMLSEWLLELAKSLGIRGATLLTAAEGIGRDGRFHSAHFFELADQPVELVMVVSEEEASRLFARLEQEDISVFYVKSPVEFGTMGAAGKA